MADAKCFGPRPVGRHSGRFYLAVDFLSQAWSGERKFAVAELASFYKGRTFG
jgi:hypothetical protein